MLYLEYICEDENEKKELKKIYDLNEEKYQKQLSEKYNPDNIFKNNKEKNLPVQNNQLQIQKQKNTFIKKIINFFKKLITTTKP